MSFDRLLKQIEKKQNPTVVGLDPVLDYIPEHIKTECFSQYGETLEGALAAPILGTSQASSRVRVRI